MKIKKLFTGVLLVSIASFIVSCNNKVESVQVSEPQEEVKELKIAYVQIDTLTSQYELYKEASENFQIKRNNAEATIAKKGQSFARQLEQFQNKLRANQLTQMQAEQEQNRLAKMQQDLQNLEQSLSVSLQEEYQKELQALTDKIQGFMAGYATKNGYDFILCKSSGIDNVLYADAKYDVTAEVVAELNKMYYEQKAAASDSTANALKK